MSTVHTADRDEVLAPISEVFAKLAPDGWGPGFVERYFRHVPEDELTSRSSETYAGAAHSQLELARSRMPGTAKVRVFNPSTDPDGWSSTRTIIQVVTDDMPFLVDSVTGALVSQGIDIHLIVHPQLVVVRDAVGALEKVENRDITGKFRAGSVGELAESWMLLVIDRESDEDRRAQLERDVRKVLEDVRQAVEDWPKMRSKCLVIAAELEGAPPEQVDADEVALATRFLRWMADDHFTFLGYRDYRLEQQDGGEVIVPVTGSGLGLLRADPPLGKDPDVLTTEASRVAHEHHLLVLTKANSKSTVHRVAHLDYVGVKTYDGDGEVVGERRFLGLYASTAYTESVQRVPLVAEKVRAVLARAGVAPDSHTGKDLLGVLEGYPRDELFQADVDNLYETAMAVTQLQERRRTKVFVREDAFGRFVSCLVFIPRDRYNTSVRLRMAEILKETFGGVDIEFSARVSESALSRLQFVVRVQRGGRVRTLDPGELDALEQRLVEVSRTWSDRLGDVLREAYGEEEGDRLLDRFGRAFPTAYEETFTVTQGLADVRHLDRLGDERGTSVALYRPLDGPGDIRRFKLFRVDPLSLTDILPIFTHMGVEVVDEQPFQVDRADGTSLHVYDFGLRVPGGVLWEACPHDRLRELFEGAVAAVWDRRAESDGFNQLVLTAHLTWREVVILRAVAKYLRQTRATYSQDYLEDALVSHPGVARDLVELWRVRFDPDLHGGAGRRRTHRGDRAGRPAGARRPRRGLQPRPRPDHPRLPRGHPGRPAHELLPGGPRRRRLPRLRLAQARPPGGARPAGPAAAVRDLRLRPAGGGRAPALRPGGAWRAALVRPPRGLPHRDPRAGQGPDGQERGHRPHRVQGRLLPQGAARPRRRPRGLARGGQGRLPHLHLRAARRHRQPGGRRDRPAPAGRAARRRRPVPRRRRRQGHRDLLRHRQRGRAVLRLLARRRVRLRRLRRLRPQGDGHHRPRRLGVGEAALPGDGDRHPERGVHRRRRRRHERRRLRQRDAALRAHPPRRRLRPPARLRRPHPDAATSYAERRRLFELPRSSWDDYDRSLISEGGGVFPRTLKSVTVTEPMREALDIAADVTSMTPAELIHAILLAPVDLLWNGGIGTYVKASTEDHLDIGDRANDGIRVDGNELRLRVVGEGGNLGLSQLGRIEAAFNGVRVNTDAIDNSAGVDTSDHEVNIKILLGEVVRDGRLTTEQRNELLASMTDDVADHVLRDNYEQNVLLGNARAQEHAMVPVHERFMRWLEQRGDLDRSLEFLPTDAELEKRLHDGLGLKSPEFSVLVAYAKLALKHDILASDIPDDPYFESVLAEYFPEPIREGYAGELAAHPLRRQIITNSIVNSMVNRGGITFAYRAQEEAGAAPEQVTRAFVVAREVFGLADFVRRVEALDTQVPTAAQTALYLEFRRLLDRSVRWFLSSRPSTLDIGAEVERFTGVVRALSPTVPDLLCGEERKRLDRRADELVAAGVPEDLAVHAAGLLDQFSLLDVVDIAADLGREPTDVAPLYYLVSERFGIDTMLAKVSRLPREDTWDALARAALRDDLYAVLESLTRSVLETGGAAGVGTDPEAQWQAWESVNEEAVARTRAALSGVIRLDAPNIAPLSVALRTLRSVIRVGSSS